MREVVSVDPPGRASVSATGVVQGSGANHCVIVRGAATGLYARADRRRPAAGADAEAPAVELPARSVGTGPSALLAEVCPSISAEVGHSIAVIPAKAGDPGFGSDFGYLLDPRFAAMTKKRGHLTGHAPQKSGPGRGRRQGGFRLADYFWQRQLSGLLEHQPRLAYQERVFQSPLLCRR